MRHVYQAPQVQVTPAMMILVEPAVRVPVYPMQEAEVFEYHFYMQLEKQYLIRILQLTVSLKVYQHLSLI